jgi:hypothetical protein
MDRRTQDAKGLPDHVDRAELSRRLLEYGGKTCERYEPAAPLRGEHEPHCRCGAGYSQHLAKAAAAEIRTVEAAITNLRAEIHRGS